MIKNILCGLLVVAGGLMMPASAGAARVGIGVTIGPGYYGPGYYGPGWGYPYGYPYGYAYPPAYPVVVSPPAPTQYIEQAPAPAPAAAAPAAANNWYFCQESQAYYPHVKSCAGKWQAVPATPPDAR